MFREKYKNAYSSVRPGEDCIEKIFREAGKNSSMERRTIYFRLRPVLAVLAVCLGLSLALQVCAANITAVYRIIERISPEMADLFVPVERSSIRQEIEMQVEAVRLDGSTAEVIVSFRDTGELDRIHGRADLYGSYNLTSHTGPADISGCSFIEYDADTDKAFFQVTLSRKEPFDQEKFTFHVGELLCDFGEKEEPVNLNNLKTQAETKAVSLAGRSISPEAEEVPEGLQAPAAEGDPRPRYRALDMEQEAGLNQDGFTMTGAVYMDEILRIQYCMGDNTHADRHMRPYLTEKDGTRKSSDYTFSWHEDVGGRNMTFYEFCFTGPFEKPQELPLYSVFYDTGESVQGNWEVTFRLE